MSVLDFFCEFQTVKEVYFELYNQQQEQQERQEKQEKQQLQLRRQQLQRGHGKEKEKNHQTEKEKRKPSVNKKKGRQKRWCNDWGEAESDDGTGIITVEELLRDLPSKADVTLWIREYSERFFGQESSTTTVYRFDPESSNLRSKEDVLPAQMQLLTFSHCIRTDMWQRDSNPFNPNRRMPVYPCTMHPGYTSRSDGHWPTATHPSSIPRSSISSELPTTSLLTDIRQLVCLPRP